MNKRNDTQTQPVQAVTDAAAPNTTQTQTTLTPDRTYKARIFEMVFREKRELLELYNAINGTDYKDPELLTVNTLENAIYMNMRNDLSFIIDSRLCLYEHQSTYNPNLPLRFLFYVADLYSGMIDTQSIYRKKVLSLPGPKFVIFYNGTDKHEEAEELRLSALYNRKTDKVSLELIAIMYNINKGQNEKLMKSCRTLSDYSEYVYRIRKYAKEMPIEDAVERAITECIAEGILADFLKKNRAEAKKMSIYEYNEEAHMRMLQEDSYAEGLEEGHKEGLAEGQKLAAKTLVNLVTSTMKKIKGTETDACHFLEIQEADYLAAKKLLAVQHFDSIDLADSGKSDSHPPVSTETTT